MKADKRRQEILEIITKSNEAVTAGKLAKHFGISRQAIVGDIALLRAAGHDITATARGYALGSSDAGGFIGTLACKHEADLFGHELRMIVALGAVVLNVSVQHELYGEITGQLNLKNFEDVDAYERAVKISKSSMLSQLTDGMHLHTVVCRDKAHFDEVKQALSDAGYLLK